MDIEWTDFLLESDFTIPDDDWLHASPTNKLGEYEFADYSNFDLLKGLDATLNQLNQLNQLDRPRNKWTLEDNELLAKIHAENEGKEWGFISAFFPSHTEKQVKRKYFALVRGLKSKRSADDGLTRPKKLKVLSAADKLKFIENVKERVRTLESAIHDSSSRIQEIMKKYQNK